MAPTLRARALAAGVLAVLLAGCATWVEGPATGPDGVPLRDRDLRRLLASGRPGLAYEKLLAGDARPGDALLRRQYEGLLAHLAGRYAASDTALRAAAALAEERFTRSLTRSALTFVTNERILAYRASPVERLMVHYYGILNRLAMPDPEGAGVEARRLSHLLDLAAERGSLDGAAGVRLHAALRYLAGAALEASGERNDADVAYRLARRLDAEGALPAAPALATVASAGPVASAVRVAATASDPAGWGEVLVVLERGFVAHPVERGTTLLVWPDELRRLRGDGRRDAGGVLREPDPGGALALRLARRALGFDSSADGLQTRGRGAGRRSKGRGGPRFLRIAWPAYARGEAGSRPDRHRFAVLGGSGSSGPDRIGDVVWVGDVSGAVVEEGRRGEPAAVARAVLRAAAKQALAHGVERALAEEDETLGQVAGTLVSAAGALVERADTRCWSLLPAEIGFVRLRVPAGSRRLAFELRGPDGARRVEVGPVYVRPGRLSVAAADVRI